MKTTISVLIILQLSFFDGSAQNIECGTDFVHTKLMLEDPLYKAENIALESQIETILLRQSDHKLNQSVYTIPVVVHVIHLGESVGTGTNISDAQITGAITGLNNRWRNNIGSGVDMEIEFCLASRDPNGNSTTGINRVNGSGITKYSTEGVTVPGCSSGAAENDVKALSRWPVASYYNIWIVNKICNGQWGGWSWYPNGTVNDGVVIIASIMTSGSSILSHEVGHGFYLYHTFEGDGSNAFCPGNTDCTIYGDKVCDTPPHKQSDCGATDVCTGTGTWDFTRYNYMSYCGGLNRFTQGQKDRVRAVAIIYPRASLLTSLGCSSVSTGIDYSTNKTFSISPNPSNGKFQLEAGKQNLSRIIIYNLLGENIYQSNTALNSRIDIDISSQPRGVYFIQLQENEKTYSKQLIIQ